MSLSPVSGGGGGLPATSPEDSPRSSIYVSEAPLAFGLEPPTLPAPPDRNSSSKAHGFVGEAVSLVTASSVTVTIESPTEAGAVLDRARAGFADITSPPRSSSRLSFDSAMGDTGGLFGFDIGGSLAKFVLFVPHDHDNRLKAVAVKLADVSATAIIV